MAPFIYPCVDSLESTLGSKAKQFEQLYTQCPPRIADTR